jgi:hypothetical protein
MELVKIIQGLQAKIRNGLAFIDKQQDGFFLCQAMLMEKGVKLFLLFFVTGLRCRFVTLD